jgi:hypothetical protein
MNTVTVPTEFETRAAEALTSLLGRVSAIKLRELQCASQPRSRFTAILAHIEVFGRSHILACELDPYAEPGQLHSMLREWQGDAAPANSDATPVVIAPYLSPEAQALCKQSHVGFLDLEGNARLSVGEAFIVMRSLPRDVATPAPAASRKSPARSAPARSGVDSMFPKGLPRISPKHAPTAIPA